MISLLNILLMATFTALGIFVRVRVPFLTWGVPILPDAEELAHWHGIVVGLCTLTLQVPLVWLSGLALGSRQGTAAQAVLLAVGLAGLPIFMKGGGPGYALEPTFGYLLGFLPAAWLSGRFARRGPAGALLGMVLGQAAMWIVGVSWQVASLGPGGWLDGQLWLRSWAGTLQWAPSYLLLMVAIALALGIGASLRRAASPLEQQREGPVVDERDLHHRAEDAGPDQQA